MNRRGFLGAIAAAVAGAALDPERALWVPGAKLYSVPAPVVAPVPSLTVVGAWFQVGDVLTFGEDLTRYVVTGVERSRVDLRREKIGAALTIPRPPRFKRQISA
jgi:hypothetical protein